MIQLSLILLPSPSHLKQTVLLVKYVTDNSCTEFPRLIPESYSSFFRVTGKCPSLKIKSPIVESYNLQSEPVYQIKRNLSTVGARTFAKPFPHSLRKLYDVALESQRGKMRIAKPRGEVAFFHFSELHGIRQKSLSKYHWLPLCNHRWNFIIKDAMASFTVFLIGPGTIIKKRPTLQRSLTDLTSTMQSLHGESCSFMTANYA